MKKLLIAVTVALSVHFSYAQSEQEYINENNILTHRLNDKYV